MKNPKVEQYVDSFIEAHRLVHFALGTEYEEIVGPLRDAITRVMECKQMTPIQAANFILVNFPGTATLEDVDRNLYSVTLGSAAIDLYLERLYAGRKGGTVQ